MPLVPDNYYPKHLYRYGHGNTFLTYFLRNPETPKFERQRINTPDDDFLDIDWLKNKNKRVAIICHGLEGDTSSQYIKGMSSALSKENWDVLAWNYRSCSKEMNHTLRMYTSGDTRDLDFLVEKYQKDYDEIALVGFSLGGNLVLKYTGETGHQTSNKIISTVGISVPCDLSSSSNSFTRPANYLYEKRFLVSLFKKVKIKSKQFPDQVNAESLKKINSILSFDHLYTAPLNGFSSGEDYYQKSSCKPFLPEVKIPSLIINALDDPFLHPLCFPIEEAKNSSYVYLMQPKYGGHVGFGGEGKKTFWSELETLKFLNSHSQNN